MRDLGFEISDVPISQLPSAIFHLPAPSFFARHLAFDIGHSPTGYQVKSKADLQEVVVVAEHLANAELLHDGYRGEIGKRYSRLVLKALPELPCDGKAFRRDRNDREPVDAIRRKQRVHEPRCLCERLPTIEQRDQLVQNIVGRVDWRPLGPQGTKQAGYIGVTRVAPMAQRHPAPGVDECSFVIHG